MLIRLNTKIELKDITCIPLKIDEHKNYSLINLLHGRHTLKERKIPVSVELRDLLEPLVRQFAINNLDYWLEVLRIGDSRPDMSNRDLADMMESSLTRLFKHPDRDIIAIEELANYHVRKEVIEGVQRFMLDLYYQMPEQDREDFLHRFTDCKTLHVYFNIYEECFQFCFPGESYLGRLCSPNESYLGEDKNHFYCGNVILTPEDVEEIFE